MSIDLINTGAILYVEIHPSTVLNTYTWCDAKVERRGGLFNTIKQRASVAGWYRESDYYSTILVSESSILEKNEVLIDRSAKQIMKKPYVKVVIATGSKYTDSSVQYFDTLDEATVFAKEIASNFPHITIKDTR